MNGIINIYKEQGYTSHDVVAKLRGILRMKKIGHTGTLDPDAVGVLPVCTGRATKLCGMITDWGKTYEAVMLLGTRTDTQDISGNILSQTDVNVTKIQIMDVIGSFTGEYDQIPPMYSALKHNGKKLYELARQGIEIERKPRRVNIKSILINDINLEDNDKTVTFTVECSKGTYIRTLCEDIGNRLGCGACMQSLKRTRVGSFSIDNSYTLSQIEQMVQAGKTDEILTPIDEMFSDSRKIIISQEYDKLLYNGNKLPYNSIQGKNDVQHNEDEQVRVYDKNDEFIGVYRFEGNEFVPVKMFYQP
jgi:tRNA pseudouridine55 synthase